MKKKPKVLLIGWDAADWKIFNPLIDAGQAPAMESFIDNGVMGNLATLQPVLSPMLWNSIATGMRPFKHGVHGFTEVNPHTNTVSPSLSTSRRVKAIWNMLSQEGYKTHVVNWFVSHPPEAINGICISELFSKMPKSASDSWKFPVDAIHPRSAAKTFEEFRINPQELSGADLEMFAPNIGKADQKNDKRVMMLANLIAEAATIHAATTHIMEHEEWDFLAVYYGCIDHFCHGFMHYHPPQMQGISDEDFHIYNDVINNAYRYHDAMLARLVQLAGDDTTIIICSDHGFHSDHLRPVGTPRVPAGPAVWHRDQGVFLMKGPNIRQDELVHGANLLDMTPTVLQVFGLPLGRDMDGRPLIECFENVEEIRTIESWEARSGEHPDGMHQENAMISKEQSDAIMEQFIALGYIDRPEGDANQAVQSTRRELKWNVARSYLDAGEVHNAIPILEEIVDECPERRDFTITLANCLQHFGLIEDAENLIHAAVAPSAAAHSAESGSEGFGILHTLSELALARGNTDEAMELLSRIDEQRLHLAGGHGIVAARAMTLGTTFMKMEEWEAAIPNFERALEVNGDLARAHLGIAQCCIKLEDYERAVDAGLHAIELEHQFAPAHYFLGVALAKSQYRDRAIEAFATALRYMPGHIPSHKRLAAVYSHLGGYDEQVRFHEQQVRLLKEMETENLAVFDEQKLEISARNETRVRKLVPFYQQLVVREEQEAKERAEQHRAEQSGEKPAPQSAKQIAAEQLPPFVIVSGLPRSGTSLMMQMLEAGGMNVMTDGQRVADIDNPEGYYEWEAVKKIAADPELMLEARGRATKVISMLLTSLPRRYRYKIIFMFRPVDEIAASQRKMIDRLGTGGADLDEKSLAASLKKHRREMFKVMPELPVSVLPVRYHGLLDDPEKVVERVVRFLGEDVLPTADQMGGVIRTDLYRNRSENLVSPAGNADRDCAKE